ncbi:MAG: hypothetical protein ACYSW3_00280 [Planctomycetota bacterium]|jgi:hypothetical protein
MKKFMQPVFLLVVVILGVLFLLSGTASADFTWVTTNQGTFQWDAVIVDGDGDPIPAGMHVEYRSYYVNSIADPTKTNPILVEQTTVLQSTVTFPGKGRYWVGVTANLVDDGSGEAVQTSDFAWSDVPASCKDGNTFGFQLFAILPSPGGLNAPTP